MSLSFILDKSHLVSFSKMMDALSSFIDHASLEVKSDRLTLGNFDSTHTVIAIASVQRDFFEEYLVNQELQDDLGIDLDDFFKAIKSSAKTISSEFHFTNETLKISLNGANSRQKSYFQLNLSQFTNNSQNLYQSYGDNLEEYACHLKIRTTDFREILTSLKVCKNEEITLEYESGMLVFTGDTSRIEYQVHNENERLLSHPKGISDVKPDSTEPISLRLGTDRLLSLQKATALSSHLDVWINTCYHPVYFSFIIDEQEANELVIGLSPRD